MIKHIYAFLEPQRRHAVGVNLVWNNMFEYG